MVQQQPLDLHGIHVEPADDEHVLLAIGDPQVTTFVHHADVAGVQPAIGLDGLRRLGRILEVALRDVVATNHDLARLHRVTARAVVAACLQFHTRIGPTREVRDRLGIVAGPTRRREPGHLGEPVGGEDRLHTKLVTQRLDHLHRNCCGPRDDEPKRRQSGRVEVGVVEHRLVDGRRPGQRGDPVAFDRGHDPRHVEDRLGIDRRPLAEACDDPRLVAE